MKFAGKAIKMGDDINTDIIAPTNYLRADGEEFKRHSFEAVRSNLYKDVTPGDILIGGRNFGCGSHRLQASLVLKSLGFSVVIAESLARLYFRNCISLGVPAIAMPGVTQLVQEGDRVEVVLSESGVTLTNLENGKKLEGTPLPPLVMALLEAGGFIPLMKKGSHGIRPKSS